MICRSLTDLFFFRNLTLRSSSSLPCAFWFSRCRLQLLGVVARMDILSPRNAAKLLWVRTHSGRSLMATSATLELLLMAILPYLRHAAIARTTLHSVLDSKNYRRPMSICLSSKLEALSRLLRLSVCCFKLPLNKTIQWQYKTLFFCKRQQLFFACALTVMYVHDISEMFNRCWS